MAISGADDRAFQSIIEDWSASERRVFFELGSANADDDRGDDDFVEASPSMAWPVFVFV